MKKLLFILLLCSSAFGQFQQKPMLGRQVNRAHQLGDFVGAWFFLEGSGGKVYDLSGNGNTGTLGTSMSWLPAKFGSGLNFPRTRDGTDYLTISPNSALRTDYITYVAWIKPGGASDGDYGGIWWDQKGAGFNRILIGDDGTFTAQFDLDTLTYNETSAAGIIPMNVWSQVAFTWDGTTGRHYVNGVLKHSKAEGGGLIIHSSSDILVGIGQAGVYEYDGLIDHILLYNRALSASEISQLYREPFCMFEQDDVAIMAKAAEAPTVVPTPYYYRGLVPLPIILLTVCFYFKGRKCAA